MSRCSLASWRRTSPRRYVAQFNVTENRPNRLCQDLVGKSAFDVVQDRLLLEARRKLLYIAAPTAFRRQHAAG